MLRTNLFIFAERNQSLLYSFKYKFENSGGFKQCQDFINYANSVKFDQPYFYVFEHFLNIFFTYINLPLHQLNIIKKTTKEARERD